MFCLLVYYLSRSIIDLTHDGHDLDLFYFLRHNTVGIPLVEA